MVAIKLDLQFLICGIGFFELVHGMHLRPENIANIQCQNYHNRQAHFAGVFAFSHYLRLVTGRTVFGHQKFNHLGQYHKCDAGINDMDIKNIHDLVHDRAGNLWLVFQVNPHHDFHQNTKQEHPSGP